MKCDRCDNEATVHLTQVQDGEVKQIHLCETCAKEAGFDMNSSVSITDILLGTGGAAQQAAPAPGESSLACPICHMQWSDFRKTGRLGCPHCYHVFREELTSLLDAMHSSLQHVGKVPAGESNRARLMARVAQLENELQEAILAERYEDAASLRDRIEQAREELEKIEAPSTTS